MELGGTKYSNIPGTFLRGKTSSTFGEVFLNLDKFHLKKVWFFSVHNLVHAKCANFCFVGKEWPRNGYHFFPFFMPNQGGCFNLKCTGQQKAFFLFGSEYGEASRKRMPLVTQKRNSVPVHWWSSGIFTIFFCATNKFIERKIPKTFEDIRALKKWSWLISHHDPYEETS